MPRGSRFLAGVLALLGVAGVSRSALALDKQGSGAHGGSVEGEDSGFAVSGALSTGVALYNTSYAARPDNSGLALMRYAAHFDVDLIGRRLSIPLDVNLFSDRLARGAGKFTPTELDVITGLTSTHGLGPGALEFGARVEQDSPTDQKNGFNQRYLDVRVRYLYSLAKAIPAIGKGLGDGDISGWLTLGWFAVNPTYAARPDNTGKALFRYAFHMETSVYSDVVSVGFDGVMFTDRQSSALKPTELDWTEELIVRAAPFELHLAYEIDHPLDRGGLVQSFVYALAVWAFDLHHPEPAPLESRGHIPSP